MPRVVAFGELLIDFTMQALDQDNYPTMKAHPGGAPGNYLAALSAYGISTGLLAKVGDDAFGSRLIDTLRRVGVDTEGVIVDPIVFTTLAFVMLDKAGNRSFDFARKPGADTMAHLGFQSLLWTQRAREIFSEEAPSRNYCTCKKALRL